MTANQCCQAGPGKQTGFSLFEMVIVILLIGILVTMAIDRLVQLQIESERVSVQHVIGTLDSAVYVHTAELVIKEGLASIRRLENTNPMDYLSKLPHNYLGVISGALVPPSSGANWYFDSDTDALVYMVKNIKYFESDKAGETRIQLKLALVYRDDIKSRNGSNIQGVRLESLHDYRWKSLEE